MIYPSYELVSHDEIKVEYLSIFNVDYQNLSTQLITPNNAPSDLSIIYAKIVS